MITRVTRIMRLRRSHMLPRDKRREDLAEVNRKAANIENTSHYAPSVMPVPGIGTRLDARV